MIVALRAPSLAKFGEVDTVPVSEKCDNPRMTRYQGRRKGGRGTGGTCPPTFKVMRKSALFKKESALFAWLTITLVCPSERYEIVAE